MASPTAFGNTSEMTEEPASSAKPPASRHLSGHTSSATCCRKVLSARLPVEATTLVDDGAELDDEAVLRVRRHGGLQKG
tara:strand:+ start:713 stop:949 length:237 start_codon:yes stop_codon:yes gene_type:complete